MGSWAYVIPTITLASNFNLKPNENSLNSRWDALWRAEDVPWIAEDTPGIAEDAPWRAEGCSMAGDRILARVVQRAVLSHHTNAVASAFFYLVNFFVLLCFELGCGTG